MENNYSLDKNHEQRTVETRFSMRKIGTEPVKVTGHAAVFNQLSEDLGGFREKIAPGAFDGVLNDDVRALFNHNTDLILARTKSGTLKLSVDSIGLKIDFEVPDTTYGRDLVVSMQRGDISQMSFGFTVGKDEVSKDRSGNLIRTITKIERLYDVSPVTHPAYPQTDISKNSLTNKVKNDAERNRKANERKRLIKLLEADNPSGPKKLTVKQRILTILSLQ